MRCLTIVAAALLGSVLTAPAAAFEPASPESAATLVHRECGACHLPFLPSFLPASAWRMILARLDNHYGEVATLPPEATARILKYYVDHSGWSWTTPVPAAGQTLPRITTQPWWKKAMGDLDFRKPRIKSRANCGACHSRAEWYMAVRAEQ
jgi:cytochrome c551/c552